MTNEDDLKDCLKIHKCFSIISKSLQTFGKWKRWLITSKKIAHPGKGDEMDIYVNGATRQDFRKQVCGKEYPKLIKKSFENFNI